MIECPVAQSARLRPDRPALVAADRVLSYRDLDEAVGRALGFLRSEGVEATDRIAAIAENCPELVVLIHAAARLGAPLALLHPRLAPVEIQAQLDKVRPRIAFAAPGLGPGVPLSALSSGPVMAAPASLDPARVQSILFTSGSSGIPKAVALTVGNHRASAIASGKNLGGDPDQRWLACLPLYHVGGLAIVLRAATYGASLDLMMYETAAVARTLSRGDVTHLSLVPTMLGRLLDTGAFDDSGTRLRAILVGGAASDTALWERLKDLSLPALRTYGLTETASQVTAERPGEFGGTCGHPLEGFRVRIVDGQRGVVPQGMTGEIEVSGPGVMSGYHGDPEATREAMPDEWLRTRDFGSFDAEGRLSVFSRRSDLIVSGGENISPTEIESVLCAHPQILEAAVLPVPHRELGQVPLALLVAREDRPSEESLRAWCRARLAPFKCPARYVFLNSLPRNGVGKLDRAALLNAAPKELV